VAVIITVAHQKGGVGKSTVAANLAVEMELPVIDLDSQHSCYLFSLLREREHGKQLSVYTPETVDELEKVLRELGGRDLIIDSGGYDNDLNRYALLVSDLVITPVAPSQIEVFGLLKFAEIVREALRINSNLKVFVLINNADPRSSRENRELELFIESEEIFNLFKTKLYRRADYRRAYSEGLSVCEYNPDGKACREVRALVSELNALL
jgi:chromosome partitioning protein